jgi:hypothetical protein
MAEHVDRFVQELAPAARAIGAEYGIDPALIITQAAIESGWGKEVAGNNYFGVKSHGQPGGQTILTHEEINGKLVPVYDSFRQYDSLEGSMRDYAQFLKDNPRYAGVFAAPNLQGQIDAIASSGYATSSKYPGLLNDVSRMVVRAMPPDGATAPAMAYAPTPAPRNQNPALKGIMGAMLPPLGPPGSGKPQQAAPKGGLMSMAWNGLTGGLGALANMGGQQAKGIMGSPPPFNVRDLISPAMKTVAGRTAIIDPMIKNIFNGPPKANVGSGGYDRTTGTFRNSLNAGPVWQSSGPEHASTTYRDPTKVYDRSGKIIGNR